MRSWWKWLIVVLLLAVAAGAWWSLGHHFVLTSKGAAVLGKRFLTFRETYVDARAWSSKDFDGHPAIKEALISEGYGALISELRREEINQSIKDFAAKAEMQVQDALQAVLDHVSEWLDQMERGMMRTNMPPADSPAAPAAGGME